MDGHCQKKERELSMQGKKHRHITYAGTLAITIIIAMCAVAVYHFLLTKKYDDLRGTWTVDNLTSFWFDGRGEGGMLLPSSEYIFHYNIDGHILSIDFEDESASDMAYKFEIKEDTLLLENQEKTSGVQILNLNRSK